MTFDSSKGLRFPRSARGAWFLTVLAALGGGYGIAGYREALPFAAAFSFLAVVTWMRTPRAFVLRVEGEELFHSGFNHRLAFADVHSLRLSHHAVVDDWSARRSTYFLIGHEGGEW